MNLKAFILILLFNCFLHNVYSQDILNGFKLLKIPRKSVPLGAEWINGVGVNGNGVEDNNIRVSESVDGGQINKNFADSLNISLLNYFGLGQTIKKH